MKVKVKAREFDPKAPKGSKVETTLEELGAKGWTPHAGRVYERGGLERLTLTRGTGSSERTLLATVVRD